jgi:hypothetical protein
MSVGPLLPDQSITDLATPRRFAVRWEAVAMAAYIGAAAIIRIVAVFHYRIDSDEPQHLHIAWAWTQGLLQYRDVFDNHMPLFQVLFAPLVRAVGERADALIAMRLAVLPLYAAMIALTFRIARSCYPRRVAVWSTIVAAFYPAFLLTSVEFRTDDLWTVFWLASIAVLVSAPLTVRRAGAAGLLLGLAAAVSAKTTLLLLSVAVGAVCVGFGRPKAWRYAAIFVAGCVIPPAAVAIYFAARGAWDPFVYGVFTHNFVRHAHVLRVILFPALVALIAFGLRRVGDSPQRRFLYVTTQFYGAALYCLWPLVEHEHWMPYYPLAAVTLIPMIFTFWRLVVIVLVEIVLVIGMGRLGQDETRDGLAIIEQTLQLTRPGESVMDLKGETVFRPRAFFYVLEPMTKHRIRDGRIADTIIADILRTRTLLISDDHYGYPRATRRFLRRNFVRIGSVRVAGRILRRGETAIEIDVPADYAIVGRTDPFDGSLDGKPYDGPRYLTAGLHLISPAPVDESFALLWSRAAENGYTPFGVVRQRTGGHRRHSKEPRCNPARGAT